MSIKVLSPEVAANIAAGEVVERPASIVKELIENSLDAGASDLKIEVDNGGLTSIQVTDNGLGIQRGDTDKLFLRHATSKLMSVEDLQVVKTLGFRGEALYSIGAVARVSIWTKSFGEEIGSFITIDKDALINRVGWGGPQGTTVKIEDLFRHIPARRKFLKSEKSELGRIQSVIVPYVLANPSVRFEFKVDGRARLVALGSGDHRGATASVYGPTIAQDLLEIGPNPEDNLEGIQNVSGLIGSPRVHRGTRSYISFFVNGRPVQSRKLGYAVIEAYKGFLPIGRFPFAIVFIGLKWDQIDVNVHPAKAEVRFQDEDQIFRLVQQAVRRTLIDETPIPGIEIRQPKSLSGLSADGLRSRTLFGSQWPRSGPSARKSFEPVSDRSESNLDQLQNNSKTSHQLSSRLLPGTPIQVLPVLRVVGQVHETYIVAEGPNGIYLIDQHAAHERVLYTAIIASTDGQRLEPQGLLEPSLVELSVEQEVIVTDRTAELDKYGWVFEEFGHKSYILRAIPVSLGTQDPARSFTDFLDGIMGISSVNSWHHRIAATIACHGSVRAGMSMGQQEMIALIDALSHVDQPHTCPHGRPSIIQLDQRDLEKEFRRI